MYRKTKLFQSIELLLEAAHAREITPPKLSYLIRMTELSKAVKVGADAQTIYFLDKYGAVLCVRMANERIRFYASGQATDKAAFWKSLEHGTTDTSLLELDPHRQIEEVSVV